MSEWPCLATQSMVACLPLSHLLLLFLAFGILLCLLRVFIVCLFSVYLASAQYKLHDRRGFILVLKMTSVRAQEHFVKITNEML